MSKIVLTNKNTINSKISLLVGSSVCEMDISIEIACFKSQLEERDKGLGILQKAATYFAKRLK